MGDDPDKAREAVVKDGQRLFRAMRDSGAPATIMSLDNQDQWPDYGDGEGVLIPFTVGHRGELAMEDAKRAAEHWRAATARYPKAIFQIVFLGYDEDPREIWEFPEVRRHLRRWARLTGLNDGAAAVSWLGTGEGRLDPPLDMEAASSLVLGPKLLALCGAFGEQARQAALRNVKPTPTQ
jgi:hypothetical protein